MKRRNASAAGGGWPISELPYHIPFIGVPATLMRDREPPSS
jgi:hypothetical protein